MDDGSCEDYDDCGECGGDGMTVVCADGSMVCVPADCPPEDPDVLIIAEHATASDGMAHVNLSYHSTVEVAGVQFTLSDDPESAVGVDYATDNGDFTASFNDSNGDVTTVYFSLTGAALPATDEATVFATLTYELTAELMDGDEVALHFEDVVCASAAGTSLAAAGVDGSISMGGMAGDVPAALAQTTSSKCNATSSPSINSAVSSYVRVANTVASSVAGKAAPVKLKYTVVTSPLLSLKLAVKSPLSVA
jgi:hypothetical protein